MEGDGRGDEPDQPIARCPTTQRAQHVERGRISMRSPVMNRLLMFVLAATCAASQIAAGQAAGKKAAQRAPESDTAETVSVLDHVWLDAAHNRDTGTMDWLFADDFVEVHRS